MLKVHSFPALPRNLRRTLLPNPLFEIIVVLIVWLFVHRACSCGVPPRWPFRVCGYRCLFCKRLTEPLPIFSLFRQWVLTFYAVCPGRQCSSFSRFPPHSSRSLVPPQCLGFSGLHFLGHCVWHQVPALFFSKGLPVSWWWPHQRDFCCVLFPVSPEWPWFHFIVRFVCVCCHRWTSFCHW